MSDRQHLFFVLRLKSRIWWVLLVGHLLPGLLPTASEAVPAFARKYDLSCTSCHTKPPRLNAFGEAFHMAGYQIPSVKDGETKKKRKIGRIWSESDVLNIFSFRATGDMLHTFQGGEKDEMILGLPQAAEVYLAGTLTDTVSYFFEVEYKGRSVEGTGRGQFEEQEEFGLGKEFFFMVDLQPLLTRVAQDDGGSMGAMPHGKMNGVMIMGPMIMAGKIDPSTNFSYPTNRQIILNVPGRVASGVVRRFGLAPSAFSAKFFGMRTGDGVPVEVTKSVLYNTPGALGIDVHMMVWNVLFQVGLQQGLQTGLGDVNQKKDPYVMVRINFGQEKYTSGSLSGMVYWGHDTAMVDATLVNWLRYGVAANIKIKYLDLYGAVIWDAVQNLPAAISSPFDRTAYGLTMEADYLLTDRLLWSFRYDRLHAGGFIHQKADGQMLTLQARYYLRDNLSMYLRDSVNIKDVSANALQSYRNLVAAGVDVAF